MDRTRPTLRLQMLPVGIATAILLAACSGTGAASVAPTASAMIEHSAVPEASAMMEHSPAPSTAGPVSKGTFHAVDGTAAGSVFLFHKPDGSFVVTFEDFSVASNAHTNVVFVTNKDVAKTGDVDKTALVDLGPLKGTTGMQDFVVPAAADAMKFHTVVLWDTEMQHAIAAAPLQ